jgi:hypothetical protein
MATHKPPSTLDEVLNLLPAQFDTHWKQIDAIIAALPAYSEQIAAWQAVLARLQPHPFSKGMPYFRLGVLHLLTDPDAMRALQELELAYLEDKHYGPDAGKISHQMGAYRLLALTKDFLSYLESEKDWKAEQLKSPHRGVVIRTLLATYDRSLAHILDPEGHSYQSFFRLIQDRNLTRFAIENYFCAEHLIESFHLAGTHISGRHDEYALARAIIGLFGGVLEAILADKLPDSGSYTLEFLIRDAHARGIIQVGTKLAAFSSMMLYLRNHIHADRDASRRAYFVDINVAKGCKVALDWVIADLLQP